VERALDLVLLRAALGDRTGLPTAEQLQPLPSHRGVARYRVGYIAERVALHDGLASMSVCDKTPHMTQLDAEIARRHIALRARARGLPEPTGSYLCRDCCRWHLTSRGKSQTPRGPSLAALST
jgi:hypothetical protein